MRCGLPRLLRIPIVDILAHAILLNPIPLLDLAFELVAPPSNFIQIVVRQTPPLFLDHTLYLLPVAFNTIPVHCESPLTFSKRA